MIELSDLLARLAITQEANGTHRVNARESTDLEFKRDMTVATFKKALKTIAAFANKSGGTIVFGIQDRPRLLVGLDEACIDDGQQSELIAQALSPSPSTYFQSYELYGKLIGALTVMPLGKPPTIAYKDLAAANGGEPLIRKGMVYVRRRGQTSPISGEEFSQLMQSRDDVTRSEIFKYLRQGMDIGFDQAVVVDPRGSGDQGGEMVFYIPEAAASQMNVIDEATLVEENGAPAYKLIGNVKLTTPSDHDPRQPMRPSDAADALKPEIKRVFWDDIPWNYSHLKKAADHLGFWPSKEGDSINTGIETLTSTPKYYQKARQAILNFAKQNPDDFISVVGSRKTQDEWDSRKNQS